MGFSKNKTSLKYSTNVTNLFSNHLLIVLVSLKQRIVLNQIYLFIKEAEEQGQKKTLEGVVAHFQVKISHVEVGLLKVGRDGYVEHDVHDAKQWDQHQDKLGQLPVDQSETVLLTPSS